MNRHQKFCRFKAKKLAEDYDWWQLISGNEGTGKSTIAIQDALFTSPEDFRKNWRWRITYDPEDFLSSVESAPKGASIILDEAGECWFNRDFQTKTNKALAKASMQIRERNLNIILCVPKMYYLDKVAIYRHRTWVCVSSPRFIRGKSEFFKPSFKKYGKADIPFWNIIFEYYFPKLPDKIYLPYKEFKSKKASERLTGYIESMGDNGHEIKKERPIDDLEKEALKINGELLESPNGRFSPSKIEYHLRHINITEHEARLVAVALNSKYRFLNDMYVTI